MNDAEAEKTGEWVVAIYEKNNSLLAVHGPHQSVDLARQATGAVLAHLGDRAEMYPLWHPDHIGRP